MALDVRSLAVSEPQEIGRSEDIRRASWGVLASGCRPHTRGTQWKAKMCQVMLTVVSLIGRGISVAQQQRGLLDMARSYFPLTSRCLQNLQVGQVCGRCAQQGTVLGPFHRERSGVHSSWSHHDCPTWFSTPPVSRRRPRSKSGCI